jgi:hypothetical protein
MGDGGARMQGVDRAPQPRIVTPFPPGPTGGSGRFDGGPGDQPTRTDYPMIVLNSDHPYVVCGHPSLSDLQL